MSNRIDVVYQDGEVVDFCCCGTGEKAQVILLAEELNTLDLRFCRRGGGREVILQAEDFSHAQVLLSHRDRMLAATEENIFFEEDIEHYQHLKIICFNINTTETRSVLRSSFWDIEPRRRGCVEGELSIALYSQKMEYALQLFFTVPITVCGAF